MTDPPPTPEDEVVAGDRDDVSRAISEKRAVYLGNLPPSAKESTLVALVPSHDSIAHVLLVRDKMSGRSKGFGFISFHSPNDAAAFVAKYREAPSTSLAEFDLEYSVLTASRAAQKSLVDYFVAHPEEMRTMHPRRLEELVAEVFQRLDYEVDLIAKPGDGGVDIVAIRRAEVDVQYLIQCKRPRIGKSVSVEPVRELLGVLDDSNATKGIIATTVRFTSPARALLDRHHWRLEGRDYDGIVDWLGRASVSSSRIAIHREETRSTAQVSTERGPRPALELEGRPITVSLAKPLAERPPRRSGGTSTASGW